MPHIRNFWLNGRPMGEIGINAPTAGLAGVPTAFLAGDKAALREIEDLVPGVVTAVAKEGLDPPCVNRVDSGNRSPLWMRTADQSGERGPCD